MKFKLVSWNVRGLNNKDKIRLVKTVMGGWNANIICLQETKLEGDVIEEIRQIWGRRWVKYACLEASVTRRGNFNVCGTVECGRGIFWRLASTL